MSGGVRHRDVRYTMRQRRSAAVLRCVAVCSALSALANTPRGGVAGGGAAADSGTRGRRLSSPAGSLASSFMVVRMGDGAAALANDKTAALVRVSLCPRPA